MSTTNAVMLSILESIKELREQAVECEASTGTAPTAVEALDAIEDVVRRHVTPQGLPLPVRQDRPLLQ